MKLKLVLDKKVNWTINQFQSKMESLPPLPTTKEFLDVEFPGNEEIPRTFWRLYFVIEKDEGDRGGVTLKLFYEFRGMGPEENRPQEKDQMFHGANVWLLQKPTSVRVTRQRDPMDSLFDRAVYTEFTLSREGKIIPIMTRGLDDIQKFIFKGDLEFEVSLEIYSTCSENAYQSVKPGTSSEFNRLRSLRKLHGQWESESELGCGDSPGSIEDRVSSSIGKKDALLCNGQSAAEDADISSD